MAAGSPEHLHTFPLAPPHRPRAQPTANGSNGGATCGAVVTYSHAICAGRKYSVFPFPYALGKMAPGRWVTMFFALSLSVRLTAALEPFTTSAVLIGAASTAYYYFSCRFQECCTKAWVPLDVKGLETSLKEQLFGQHIALDVIPKAIEGFLSNKDAKKPLTLSLHGWTGTGKSFVSRIIAESLYKNGMDSKYVHKFVTSYHFPNVQHTSKYIQQLQDWIRGNVSLCKRSLFIFDEMDKMNPELIDSIKPFLEYYSHLDGVVYRKAMFIFLSNAGGEKINDIVLDFWQRGMKREDIQQKDLENSLSLEVYNNKNSGFWHTRLIDKYLIDYFIPFLPLEYKHVVLCAKAELYTRHLEDVDQVAIKVAEEMVYFPKDQRVFSVKGCKTVAAKVNYWTAADSKL